MCSSLLGLLLSLGRDAAAAAAAAADDDDVFVESCAADSCMKPDGVVAYGLRGIGVV